MIGQAVSLVGAALILAAYAGQQAGKLSGDSPVYLVFNLVGAAILTYFAIAVGNWGLIVLEGSWTLISLYSLSKRLIASPPR